jgi:hypothetical protein
MAGRDTPVEGATAGGKRPCTDMCEVNLLFIVLLYAFLTFSHMQYTALIHVVSMI